MQKYRDGKTKKHLYNLRLAMGIATAKRSERPHIRLAEDMKFRPLGLQAKEAGKVRAGQKSIQHRAKLAGKSPVPCAKIGHRQAFVSYLSQARRKHASVGRDSGL